MSQKHMWSLLVFRVYCERPIVIDGLNLKLWKIAIFSSNVILDEMSSARRKTTLPYTLVTSRFQTFSKVRIQLDIEYHVHLIDPVH